MTDYAIDTLGEFIASMFLVVKSVLLLKPQVFEIIRHVPLTGLVTSILVVAGVSRMLGQCVVLFANQVSKARFFISLLLSAIVFVFEVLLTVLVVIAVTRLLWRIALPVEGAAKAIALAYAPYWLGFLVLIPYLGLIIDRLLKLYVYLAMLVALMVTYQIGFVQGLVALVIAFLILLGLTTPLSRLMTPLVDRVITAIFGVPERLSTRKIYENFAEKDKKLGS
jgi:hypothetical protein